MGDEEKPSVGSGKMVPIETSSEYLANERILLPEDAVSCFCYIIFFLSSTIIELEIMCRVDTGNYVFSL